MQIFREINAFRVKNDLILRETNALTKEIRQLDGLKLIQVFSSN